MILVKVVYENHNGTEGMEFICEAGLPVDFVSLEAAETVAKDWDKVNELMFEEWDMDFGTILRTEVLVTQLVKWYCSSVVPRKGEQHVASQINR
jgi:hypothetical protein